MILATHVTNKRKNNVKKLLKVGKIEFMQAFHIDKENNYIDLSKKNIQPKDIEEKKAFYDKSKVVHLIMK